VEDMTELGVRSADPVTPGPGEPEETGLQSAGSIWPHVDARVVEEVLRHRSTIVFANSRRLAERLTAAMNEIHEEMVTGIAPERFPAAMVGQSGVTGRSAAGRMAGLEPVAETAAGVGHGAGLRPVAGTAAGASGERPEMAVPLPLARAHHGSVSKEQRAQIEDDLKSGRLRCVV